MISRFQSIEKFMAERRFTCDEVRIFSNYDVHRPRTIEERLSSYETHYSATFHISELIWLVHFAKGPLLITFMVTLLLKSYIDFQRSDELFDSPSYIPGLCIEGEPYGNMTPKITKTPKYDGLLYCILSSLLLSFSWMVSILKVTTDFRRPLKMSSFVPR